MGKKLVDGEGGFEKATAQNLPVVDAFMVAQYFCQGCFLSPEIRNVKTAQSFLSIQNNPNIIMKINCELIVSSFLQFGTKHHISLQWTNFAGLLHLKLMFL